MPYHGRHLGISKDGGGGGGEGPWTGILQASGGYVVWNSKSMGGELQL